MSQQNYRDGLLTRRGMEAALQQGGSILYDGRVITQQQNLPSVAELAGNDEDAVLEAQKQIDEQQRELDRQRELLKIKPKKAKGNEQLVV